MARTFRNLQVALGVVFSDRGIGAFEKKMRAVEQRLDRVDRVARAGAGLGALAGAATSAGAALAPAAGAVLALPGALSIAKTATATMKVALIGMGEAMTAIAEGDAAALDEAMVKLSPNARKFASAADQVFGSLKAVQQAVQDRAFAGLDRELRPVADNLLPTIRSGMVGVADGFNAGAREAAKFAQTPVAKGAVNQVFASTGRVMGMLADATRPALSLITQLTVKSLPLAERMASWAVNGVKAGAAFVTSERGAAGLERTVDRAGETLAQLGRIGGNTIRGLIGVFSQAKGTGDGLLDTLEQGTARFAEWSRSVEGQRQSAETFRLLRDMAVAVVDVLPLLLGPLGAFVKLINGLPEPLRDGAVQLLAVAVVTGTLTGRLRPLLTLLSGLGNVVRPLATRIGDTAAAMRDADAPAQTLRDRLNGVGGAAGRARGLLSGAAGLLGGPWGIAITAGIAALTYFATRNDEAEQRVRDLTDALKDDAGALGENTRAHIVNRLEREGLLQLAQKHGVDVRTFTNATLGETSAIRAVNQQLSRYTTQVTIAGYATGGSSKTMTVLTDDAQRLNLAIVGTNGDLAQARESFRRVDTAMGGTAGASSRTASGIDDVGTAAENTAGKVDALNRRLAKFRSLNGDADLSAIAVRDSLEDLSEAFAKNNIKIDRRTGLIDINNKKGREANRILIDSIQTVVDHSDKVHKQTKNVDKANAVFSTEITRLRGVLEQSNLSKAAIDRLIRRYATMPSAINGATGKIKNRKVLIEVKAAGKLVGFRVSVGGSSGTVLNASGGILDAGVLPGYTPGRDPHMFYSPTGGALGLSGGEAVMRPEWTRAVGPAEVERLNAAARRGGVTGVKRALAGGVGPAHMRGEGAFSASGGIIHADRITGLSSVEAMASRANALYGNWAGQIGQRVSKIVDRMYQDAASGGPKVARALTWARTQAGKPYIWGGVGPRGYDCSGWWSVLLRKIKGLSPLHTRMFTTYSFGARSGPGGFIRNHPSPVRVGVTDAGVGHMAGSLGSVATESSGSRGVRVGGGARGYNNGLFTRWYGLKMADGGVLSFDEGGVWEPGRVGYNGTSKPEYVFNDRQMREGVGGGITIQKLELHFADDRNMYEKGREFAEGLREYKRRGGKLPTP
ncbi:hypothetical protein [Spongiactinospora sp. TRM90649]|uniref:hypothetical protein n=1 Tax=Spongiactinospora sp. TRM90649 TaxID=3031114 RepID=UPI0023F62135|nr:hypothetical protein [Spongiactinospora sp. TRM90649]MDF5755826.1 hypothetical protein [Spongiactinospora sp. TRM90649]